MVHDKSHRPAKRRVWRVTPNAPQGEYVDPDALPRERSNSLERPEPGWLVSSFELTHGLEVSEDNSTLPGDLFDDLPAPQPPDPPKR